MSPPFAGVQQAKRVAKRVQGYLGGSFATVATSRKALVGASNFTGRPITFVKTKRSLRYTPGLGRKVIGCPSSLYGS
jgi:hypothetical protein